MRASHLIILALALSGTGTTKAADRDPQPERKDAAESVGEGNAARWLEYYRRERGESWESKRECEDKSLPGDPGTPAPPAR